MKEITLSASNVHTDSTSTSVYPVIDNIVYSDTNNQVHVYGSIYSTQADITNYYICGFANKLDNANSANICTYIVDNASQSHVESVNQTINKNTIFKFEHTFTRVFESVDSAASSTESIQEGTYYDFRIVAIDESNNKVLPDRFVRTLTSGYDTLIFNNIYASGLNNIGQLFDGTTTQQTTPVQVLSEMVNDIQDMYVGNLKSCYRTKDNKVFIVGSNGNGDLGIGNTTNTT